MSPTLDLRDARIVRWGPVEFAARVREAMTIYAEAMGYSPTVVDNRTGYATAHADRPGFHAVAALDPDGALLGFGYGYTSEPGQWWHDQVRSALSEPDAAVWLEGAFEVCELHVRPPWHGSGLGRAMLLRLLEGLPHPAVLLSTPEGESRAWRLYRSLGFQDLARDHLFPGDSRPFAVLGARLPLTATETSPVDA